jgi:hypothetical protein
VIRTPGSEFFRIGKYFGVPHASIVLKDPIFSRNNSPLESANPFFVHMINSIHDFSKKYDLIN